METSIVESEPEKARKRPSKPKQWKREMEKQARHTAKELPIFPTCGHNGKTYKCLKLKMRDIREFHANFYSHKRKISQDAFLLKYLSLQKPRRERNMLQNSSRKGISIQYYIKLASSATFQLQICQKAFLGILNVSKDRVQRIARNHVASGKMPLEKRGGDRLSARYEARRNRVKSFISNFKGVESHYCRSKNICRQYLPSELNIKKMFESYNESVITPSFKVKKTFFREIFLRNFNVGFGTPATDACSRCLELSERIKTEKGEQGKAQLIAEKRVHKLRSNAFFLKLKDENPELLLISFDCQKNLVNPKVPDQTAYYSRQLYTYNFTIVKGTSKSKLTQDNVFIYTWLESEFSKGSNQICSAVFDFLSGTNLAEYSAIRFCADGCGGQNRNSTMIAMCSHFLKNVAPPNIKVIELVFPVPGHSFLPADRVFGRIEKILKKEATITDPQRYIDIFRKHGTVKRLGKDCYVGDFKSEGGKFFKNVSSWHFKFSEAKRFLLTKNTSGSILLRGEVFYNSDIGVEKSILKKGKNLSSFHPQRIPEGNPVHPEKLRDVKKLLTKHFGDKWTEREDLTFFKNLLDRDMVDDVDNQENDDADYCEANAGESSDLRV